MSQPIQMIHPGGPERTPAGRFLPVGRFPGSQPVMVSVEITIEGPVDAIVPHEVAFGDPGSERIVHKGDRTTRFSLGTPLRGEELVSIRYPQGIPDSVIKITTVVQRQK